MKEVSKELKCLVLRNGVEIWKEASRLDDLASSLTSDRIIGFIKIDDEIVNSVEIVGIFNSQSMEEHTRRKNGEWKCSRNNWHQKGIKCECKVKEMNGEQLAKFAQGR